MKKLALIFVVGVAIISLVAGCKKSDYAEKITRIEAKQDRQEREFKGEINSISADVTKIQKDVEELRTAVDLLSKAEASAAHIAETEATTGETAVTPSGKETEKPPTADAYQSVMTELAALREELQKTKADLEETKRDFERSAELERLRDPREQWRAMGDPKELATRVEKLAATYAPKIEDANTRAQFQEDVRNYVNELSTELSDEELYQKYHDYLTERINTETNERMRSWQQRQLQSLEQSEGEARQARLSSFVRTENMRQLGEIVSKYQIPAEELTNHGLLSRGYGGPRRRPD